jgi:hypothetical protein
MKIDVQRVDREGPSLSLRTTLFHRVAPENRKNPIRVSWQDVKKNQLGCIIKLLPVTGGAVF